MVSFKTFTADRGSQTRNVGGTSENIIDTAFPGHGMVAPSTTTLGGVETRGQGRFIAISEVGLHIICTADGTNDEGSYRLRRHREKFLPRPFSRVNIEFREPVFVPRDSSEEQNTEYASLLETRL